MQTSDIKIQCESTAWQPEAKYQDLRAPASRNVQYFVHLIFEQIKGASFQVELLVMTLLGLANCTLNWRAFDWKSQAEKIEQVPMTSEYSTEIKTVLRWVIIARIIIDHMYFATYLGNLYSVFTWCRPEALLPWMIVSALKNVLLELIPLIVTSLLYLEGNFPSILFAEFIIESLITFVPAVYYWCGIKSLFVELGHLKRRKLTRTNLIGDSDNSATYFDNNVVDNYDIKRKKFMSLINFDDLSFHSAFEFEGDHEPFRQTKSLTTLTTMDSEVSVEPEELLTLPIIEDPSLAPPEKAMKILGLTEDDVNQTRARLGKSILVNESKPQQMEDRSTENQNESGTNEVILSQEETKLENEGQSNLTFPNIIQVSSTQNPSHYPTNDENPPKRCTCHKTSDVSPNVEIPKDIRNPMNKIPEDEREDHEENENGFYGNEDLRRSASSITESSKKNINDELGSFEPSVFQMNSDDVPRSNLCKNVHSKKSVSNTMKNCGPSVFWSVDFPRSNPYKVPDSSDRSYDEGVKNSETNSSASQLNCSFQTPVNEDIDEENVNFLHSTSGNVKGLNVELSKTNEISLQQQNQLDDNAKGLGVDVTLESFKEVPRQCSLSRIKDHLFTRRHTVEENVENDTGFPNTLDVDIQTDFEDNADKSMIGIAEAEFFPNISRISTSTQTNISDFWKKTLKTSIKPLEAVLDQHSSKTSTFSESSPEDLPTTLREMFPPGIARFAKMKRRPENIKEREAREMKALRAYNRLTLVEDKREMELKKRNSAFNNRTGLKKLICSPNWMNGATSNIREVPKADTKQRPDKQMVQPEIHQLPKRQTRSRPQEKTSKLSTFNLGLEALENSISLSFSSDNKNRSKPYQVSNPNQMLPNSQHDGRKQLSKYSKPMRNIDEVSSPSTARSEGLQTGRDLDRTRGTENIIHRNRNQGFDQDFSNFDQNRPQEVFSLTALSPLDSLQTQRQNPLESVEFHDRVQLQDKYGLASLKEAIINTDWGFNGHNLHGDDIVQHENGVTNHENVLYDIIDNTDFTISLLQSAFASNPENTERGFHLGPGSTELYSVSHYLDDVVKEIMKTSRFRPNRDTFPAESTTEVDYGFSYLQEFEVISAVSKVTTENSDEETDSNSDTEKNDDTRMQEVDSIINVHTIPAKPVEMCWNSNSREEIEPFVHSQHSIIVTNLANEGTEEDHFDSQSYQNRWKFKSPKGGKSIAELLSEQEISYVEYWAKELKDLASNDRRNDFEFTKEFQHLTRLPGFCVIKMLVDFFRDFVAVSRSTMTSRMFLGTGTSSTPSSLGSEEFISGQYNELSNTSTGNELATITNNFGNVQVNESEVSDALHTLIDRLMDNTERNDSPNNPVFEVHDNRSISPLREDQFYFGTPGNTYRFIKEVPTSKPEAEMIPNSRESRPQDIDTQQRVAITFYILGTAQDPIGSHEQEVTLSGRSGGPFRPDSTDDSFDSLYSAVFAKKSKTSNNVASIGTESSLEEFPEDPN